MSNHQQYSVYREMPFEVCLQVRVEVNGHKCMFTYFDFKVQKKQHKTVRIIHDSDVLSFSRLHCIGTTRGQEVHFDTYAYSPHITVNVVGSS